LCEGYLKDEYDVLVGYTNMHFFQFFVDSSRWPMMYNKVFPIYQYGALEMALQFDCGSLMIKVVPSFLMEFENLFFSILFGGIMIQSQ